MVLRNVQGPLSLSLSSCTVHSVVFISPRCTAPCRCICIKIAKLFDVIYELVAPGYLISFYVPGSTFCDALWILIFLPSAPLAQHNSCSSSFFSRRPSTSTPHGDRRLPLYTLCFLYSRVLLKGQHKKHAACYFVQALSLDLL
jgi:hypothetical protein